MPKIVAAKNASEQLVLDFVHAAYGEQMDIDAMTALMADDFAWQLHVPLSPVIVGRDAARAELEKHSQLSTGMIEGSGIRTVVSDGDTVVVERVDVNAMGGVAVSFNVTAIFEVRDGSITHWREYWDTTHVARQLGIDPAHMFDPLDRRDQPSIDLADEQAAWSLASSDGGRQLNQVSASRESQSQRGM